MLSLADKGHSPHGECGLKFTQQEIDYISAGHSPHGECGLKSVSAQKSSFEMSSLPAWGVRVEICLY